MNIMDKYLNEIRSYLTVLDQETVNKELENIKNVISERLNNGESFEKLNLINAKEQAILILKSYNINPDVVVKKKKGLKNKFNEIIEAFNGLLNIMGNNDLKANLKIIFDIILLLIFVSLVKIPFIAIRNVGESLLQNINFPLGYDIWGFAIEAVYIIIAIMIIINVFPKWFKNLKPSPKKQVVKKEVPIETKKMGNDLESISLTDNKDNK